MLNRDISCLQQVFINPKPVSAGLQIEGVDITINGKLNGIPLEPPNPAICVGNGFVMEATNDVRNLPACIILTLIRSLLVIWQASDGSGSVKGQISDEMPQGLLTWECFKGDIDISKHYILVCLAGFADHSFGQPIGSCLEAEQHKQLMLLTISVLLLGADCLRCQERLHVGWSDRLSAFFWCVWAAFERSQRLLL